MATRGGLGAALFLATAAFAENAAAQGGLRPTPSAGSNDEPARAPTPLSRGTPEERTTDVRRELLTRFVGAYVGREDWGEVVGYVQAVLGVGFGALGAASLAASEDPAPVAAALTTGVVSTALVGGSLFASRDTRVDILQVNIPLVLGGVAMTAALHDDSDIPPLTAGAAAGASFLYGGLMAVNFASRRTPLHKLRRHKYRLQDGSALDSELDLIEEDFEQAELPISYQVLALPWGAGAIVALVPALDEGSSKDEKTWSAAVSGFMALNCTVALLTVNLVPAYREALANLEISAGPTNVDLRYRF